MLDRFIKYTLNYLVYSNNKQIVDKCINIVYCSINSYYSEHGRAMQIYSRLADIPKIKLSWIDPPKDPTFLIANSLSNIRKYKNINDKINVYVPPIGFPFYLSTKFSWIITEKILMSYINHSKLKCDLLIISHPIFVNFAKSFIKQGVPIIYDCRDFFSKWIHHGKFAIEKEQELLSICDLVITPTESLKEEILKINPNCNVFTIYNGVPKYMIKKCDKSHIYSNPKIGFIGAMGYHTDFDLVFNVAKERPEWDFIFVGDQSGIKNIVKTAPNNCKFIGELPFDRLESILCTFNVGIIPFKQSELTDVVFPIKLVEYFAKGIPVVCTPLKELKKITKSHLIHFANNKEEWTSKTEDALKDTRNEDFVEFAKEYTWEEAVEKYMQCIKKLLPAPIN